MPILRRGVAACVAVALAGLTALPAGAASVPGPRNEEWWFAAWGVQDRLWPSTKGAGVTVAVLDTGVNAGLPELSGAVLPGADLLNGGGDGRTDTDNGKELGSPKYAGHGTAMAALIAGQGGGTSRMVGVAPEAKILPIVTGGFADQHAKSIRYAVDHGAKVISMSVGVADTISPGNCPTDLQQAVAYAVQKNVVIVVASGNTGNTLNRPEYPGACAGVLAVGAVDGKKRAWPYTQRQSYVAASAPGWGVGSVNKRGEFMNNISGTSQAAALTAGAVALIRAKMPELSARDVVSKLINSAVDAGPKGHDNQTGAGVIVPDLAIKKAVNASSPNPTFERLDQWLAAQPKTSAPSSAASAATPPAENDSSSSSSVGPVEILFVLFILGAIALVVLLVVRSRRKGQAPNPQGPGAPGGYPPGTPPSFGGPYQQPGPPPPGGQPAQQPQFLPPSGAPQPAGRPPYPTPPAPPETGSRPESPDQR